MAPPAPATLSTKHKTPWLLIGEKTPHFDNDIWELFDTSEDWSQQLNRSGRTRWHEAEWGRLRMMTPVARMARAARQICLLARALPHQRA
jgi:hypothetical protein